MKLTVLGCGDAFGNGGRSNTSFLLSHQREHVLIDCGASTLIRLKAEKIDLENISTIVITHFHGDHFGGIPFLMVSSLFESKRTEPLTIIGPKGVEEKVLQLQEIMYPGTASKLSSLDLTFLEFQGDDDLWVGDKCLRAFPVEHSPESNPHGIKLWWAHKLFAFTGDTSLTDSIITLAENADLFVCECNFLKGQHFGHLSYEEVETLQDSLECKQLWLTHMNEEAYTSNDVKLNKLHDGLKIEF